MNFKKTKKKTCRAEPVSGLFNSDEDEIIKIASRFNLEYKPKKGDFTSLQDDKNTCEFSFCRYCKTWFEGTYSENALIETKSGKIYNVCHMNAVAVFGCCCKPSINIFKIPENDTNMIGKSISKLISVVDRMEIDLT